jgi:hypothetical protein
MRVRAIEVHTRGRICLNGVANASRRWGRVGGGRDLRQLPASWLARAPPASASGRSRRSSRGCAGRARGPSATAASSSTRSPWPRRIADRGSARRCSTLDRCLDARAIHDLTVALMIGNDDALRLHQARGLEPAEAHSGDWGAPATSPSGRTSGESFAVDDSVAARGLRLGAVQRGVGGLVSPSTGHGDPRRLTACRAHCLRNL